MSELSQPREVLHTMPTVTSSTEPESISFRTLQFRRIDLWLENKIAPLVILVAFSLTIVLMSRSHKYYDEVAQRVEASLVAIMASISTYNFKSFGQKLAKVAGERECAAKAAQTHDASAASPDTGTGNPPDPRPTKTWRDRLRYENEFGNNVYTFINAFLFGLALYLLSIKERPFWYVLAVFLIFFFFVASNLRQTRKLTALLHKKQSKRLETGALLLEGATWLNSENGPSMVAYAVLVCTMAVAHAFRFSKMELLGSFAAGAATFHLTVSVFGFFIGLKYNHWEKVTRCIDWDFDSGQLQIDVGDCTEGAVKLWERWRWRCALSLLLVVSGAIALHAGWFASILKRS